MKEAAALVALLAVVAFVNVLVTIRALRDKVSLPGQKIAQIVFIWLLPPIGAVIVWLFLSNDTQPRARGYFGEGISADAWDGSSGSGDSSSHHDGGSHGFGDGGH